MSSLRGALAVGGAALLLSLGTRGAAPSLHAQTPDRSALTGAWTLNSDLSDATPSSADASNGNRPSGYDGARPSGRRRGMGGGMRRGGMGGGNNPSGMSADDAARMRDAMHDIMTAPPHITVTQTDTMVLVTAQDGRTTRLAPDGSKVKDDSTHIERKTKWDGAKLVSEISGAGPGKLTETYAVDPDHHQLHVTLQTEGGHGRKPLTMNRVYDLDPQ
jgi:hypothetical protein